MSRNTVKKYVDGLIEKRLIEAEPTQVTTAHGRRNGNLCYTVRPIEEAVQANYDRQIARLEEENRRRGWRSGRRLARRLSRRQSRETARWYLAAERQHQRL